MLDLTKQYKIIDNTSCHWFDIGEIVTLTVGEYKKNGEPMYTATSVDNGDTWYVKPDEIEVLDSSIITVKVVITWKDRKPAEMDELNRNIEGAIYECLGCDEVEVI